jgi:hypothetical protein
MKKSGIEEEWLFYAEPKKREQHYFYRTGQEISYNTAWKKSSPVKIEPIIEYVKPIVLFISVLSQFNADIGTLVVNWFHKNKVAFDLSDDYFVNKTASLLADPEYHIAIHHLIHQAQLGFKAIKSDAIGKNKSKEKLSQDFLDFAFSDE